MDKENKKILSILCALKKPISNIDGGCGYCIEAFIEEFNEILVELEVPYYYEDTGDEVVMHHTKKE